MLWNVPWASIDNTSLMASYQTFRLHNMFESNPCNNINLMRQQIISTLIAVTQNTDRLGTQGLMGQLHKLPYGYTTVLKLRPGASWVTGPSLHPLTDPRQPVSDTNPHRRLNATQFAKLPAAARDARPITAYANTTRGTNPGNAPARSNSSTTTHLTQDPHQSGLVDTPVVRIPSSRTTRDAEVEWANEVDAVQKYCDKDVHHGPIFTPHNNPEKSRQWNAVHNSFQATSAYDCNNTATINDKVDDAFRGEYKYIKSSKVRQGDVILIIDALLFFNRAVRELRRYDYSISCYSHAERKINAYVDNVTPDGEITIRILLPHSHNPVRTRAQEEALRDNQCIWPE
eukprot:gene42958-53299_t